jgi:hypothetical protein
MPPSVTVPSGRLSRLSFRETVVWVTSRSRMSWCSERGLPVRKKPRASFS